MMLLSFVALGAVFGFVFSLVTLVENILLSRILSFVLDVFMMLSFAVVFFCFVIGFGTDGFRGEANKGLTAETDERIKQNGIKTRNTRIATGSYENPWNKGKTKETDAILQTVSDKVSQARQNKF